MAGAVLLVRNRYDLRGVLLVLVDAAPARRDRDRCTARPAVALHRDRRRAGGLDASPSAPSRYAAYRRYPRAPRTPLGEDAREIRVFAIQSTIASGLTSLRTSLPTVLVGVVASARQTGYFRAAQAPSTAFASLSAPARLVLLAEQTRDVEHGRADRAYALLRRYIAGTALLGLVITPVLWWAMPTLIRWV